MHDWARFNWNIDFNSVTRGSRGQIIFANVIIISTCQAEIVSNSIEAVKKQRNVYCLLEMTYEMLVYCLLEMTYEMLVYCLLEMTYEMLVYCLLEMTYEMLVYCLLFIRDDI